MSWIESDTIALIFQEDKGHQSVEDGPERRTQKGAMN